MLDSLKISGYRRYDNLSLQPLGKVNFILGNNNIGKTSILESVFAWACGQSIVPFVNVPLTRCRYRFYQSPYIMMEELLSAIHDRSSFPFHMSFNGSIDGRTESFEHTIYPSELLSEYDSSYKSDKGRLDWPQKDTVAQTVSSDNLQWGSIPQVSIAKWTVTHNNEDSIDANLSVPFQNIVTVKPFHNARFVDLLAFTSMVEIVQVYASLKRQHLLSSVVEQMNRVFPDIAEFDMIPYPDGSQSPVSIVKTDGTMLPIYAYGDGVQKWFYLIGTFSLNRGSIICIDEVDVGFHPKAQKAFCSHIIQAALENQVQLFMTTHNIEFMDKFLSAAQELDSQSKKEIRILTLRESEHGIHIRNIDAEETKQARDVLNLELR